MKVSEVLEMLVNMDGSLYARRALHRFEILAMNPFSRLREKVPQADEGNVR
jgi:hypothetical protein